MKTLILSAATLGLVACTDHEVACDLSASASVSIIVTDTAGLPLAPTTLTYTVDGGEELAADCINDDCSEAVAAWEVAGEFVITATYTGPVEDDDCCWHDDQVQETVIIEQGECHVVGQTLTLVLDPEVMNCADDSGCG